jgi:hypothetical protein
LKCSDMIQRYAGLVLPARWLRGLMKGWCYAVLAALLAWGTTAHAQSTAPPMPSASSASPLPKMWPAEEERAMLQKLIDLAEGPPPSIEELSKALGITIEKGWNYTEELQGYDIRGPHPFGQKPLGRYLLIPKSKQGWSLSINLQFDDVTKQTSLGGRAFCIGGGLLTSSLEKQGWTHYKYVVQPHSVSIHGWKKFSPTYNRNVGWRPGSSHCAGSVSIGYEIPHNPDEKILSFPSNLQSPAK